MTEDMRAKFAEQIARLEKERDEWRDAIRGAETLLRAAPLNESVEELNSKNARKAYRRAVEEWLSHVQRLRSGGGEG